MNESGRLAEELRRALEGGAWHGPSWREMLATIDWATAVARPVPSAHTIDEIVRHMITWHDIVRRRLDGESAVTSVEDGWPASATATPEEWPTLVADVGRTGAALRETIARFPADRLHEHRPGLEDTWYGLISGSIQHVVYHLGQIPILVKAAAIGARSGGSSRERAVDGAASARELLRHTLATLAYRAEKVLRDVPVGFAATRVGPRARTPLEILSHLVDLIQWAERLARGEDRWEARGANDWDNGVTRFFQLLTGLDSVLRRSGAIGHSEAQVFQGPIADALTHVGQLALLRGLWGSPVRPESYLRARIAAGRVGREQQTAVAEFDGDASAQTS